MLEKRIVQKILDKMDTIDPQTAKLMLERTGIVFTFSGGISGRYVRGMMNPTGSGNLVDFDPEAITGFLVSNVGAVGEGLEVNNASQLQDLQNQVAEKDKLIAAANLVIDEMRQEAGVRVSGEESENEAREG